MRKKNLLKTVALSSFACVCTAAMVTGILAATSHTVNITTSVSFTATGVSGTLTGALKGHTNGSSTIVAATAANGILTADATDADFEYSFNNSSTASGWTTGALSIATNNDGLASTLIMEFTVENKGSNDIGFSLSFSDTASTNITVSFEYDKATTANASSIAFSGANYVQNNPYVEIASGETGVFRIIYDIVDTAQSGTTLTPAMSINLAPHDSNKYGVAYFANGATSGTVVTDVVTTATTLAAKTVGTETGNINYTAPTDFVFKGWNTSADGTGTKVANLNSISANKVLYAQWITQIQLLKNVLGSNIGDVNIYSDDTYGWQNYTYMMIDNEEYVVIGAGTNWHDLVPSIENNGVATARVDSSNANAELGADEILVLKKLILPEGQQWDTTISNSPLNRWGGNASLNIYLNPTSEQGDATGGYISGEQLTYLYNNKMSGKILKTTAYGNSGGKYGALYTESSPSKVFLLACQGELNGNYGYTNDLQNYIIDTYLGSNWNYSDKALKFETTNNIGKWWLRTGCGNTNLFSDAVIPNQTTGPRVIDNVFIVGITNLCGVRPAFVLDLSSNS